MAVTKAIGACSSPGGVRSTMSPKTNMSSVISAKPESSSPVSARMTGSVRSAGAVAWPSFNRAALFALRACAKGRSEEHTSELQSLMRISYAVFCLKKKKQYLKQPTQTYYKYLQEH